MLHIYNFQICLIQGPCITLLASFGGPYIFTLKGHIDLPRVKLKHFVIFSYITIINIRWSPQNATWHASFIFMHKYDADLNLLSKLLELCLGTRYFIDHFLFYTNYRRFFIDFNYF